MASNFAKRLDLAAVLAVCFIATLSTSSIAISLMTYDATQHENAKMQLKVMKRDPYATNIDGQISQLAVNMNATHSKLDEMRRSRTDMFWSLVRLHIGVHKIALQLHRGTPGLPGVGGRPGSDGPPGPSGSTGEKGDMGAVGPVGLPGDPGPLGLKGDPGVQVHRGQTGSKGWQGAKGRKGPRGEKGKKGEKGEKGIVRRIPFG